MQKNEELSYRWWIPISYTSSENPDFQDNSITHWMSDEGEEIVIEEVASEDDWLILNIQEMGYYRVNYDQNNWLALINQLKSDLNIIHTANRAQLLDDSFNIARAGMG